MREEEREEILTEDKEVRWKHLIKDVAVVMRVLVINLLLNDES